MKQKIIKTIIPPIAGISSVLLLLFLYNLAFDNGSVLNSPDNGFFTLFVPVTLICALIIQLTLVLPIWEQFKTRKILKMNLIQFIAFISVIGGIIFGFVFWERSYGLKELLLVTLTGIIAFAIYWIIDILVLQIINK